MGKLDRQPLFSQLADILRRELERDGYPGYKVASERDLAARFEVSPVTVREALGILREEGLIERRHGSGSYVLERRRPRIGVVLDFDIADQGLSHFYRSSTQAARRYLMEHGYEAPLYAGVRRLEDGKAAVTCREFITDVQTGQLQGVVALAALPDPAWVEPAEKQKIPVVGSPKAFRHGLLVDHDAMIRDGVRLLAAAGCTRLALIDWTEPHDEGSPSPRAESFRAILQGHGLAYRAEWVRDSLHPALPGAGWEEFREIWSASPEKPDGLLICDDMLFPDVASAIGELAINVPAQLQVVTHANRGSRIRYPFPVTLLEIDPEEYGRRLAQKVIGLLRDGRLEEPVSIQPHRIVSWPAHRPDDPAELVHPPPQIHRPATFPTPSQPLRSGATTKE